MNVLLVKRIIIIVITVISLLILNTVCWKLRKKLKHKGFKVGLSLVSVLGSIMLLLMLGTFLFTDYILYYPHFNKEAYLQLQNNENLEELEINTPVGKCAGWMYHSMKEGNTTIILYPGNMFTSEEMMGYSTGFDGGTDGQGINVITLDYPGYGRSEGIPTERTMKSMALAAYDAIISRSDMQDQKIVLMGYSLGTGIANYVASKRDADGLILMAPYQNGYDLFNGFADIFHGPMKLFVPYRMRADKFAEKISVKPLVMMSKDDELISYESSLALSEKYPAGCEMKTYDGLGHGGFWQDNQVWQDIFEYLSDISEQNGAID